MVLQFLLLNTPVHSEYGQNINTLLSISLYSLLFKASKDTPKSNELYLLIQANEEISHRLKDENEALRVSLEQ